MSLILTLLATYNKLSNYFTLKCVQAASWIRSILGPEPQNWHLLQDGRVLSASIVLPPHILSSAYRFDIQTNQLTKMDSSILTGRYRPLSILALQVSHPDVGDIDLSDWIGEIRMFPARDVTPRQLVDLWSASQNRYVPIEDARAIITRSDGTEETIDLT
jgi:hypothetical protein